MIMKRFLLTLGLVTASLPATTRAADAIWINSGLVTVPPQINATNVVNNGTININTLAEFQTSNTQNYTNRGSMTGSIGWKLHHAPTGTGQAKAAATFHNHPGASLVANDEIFLLPPASSRLTISATNIINEGLFSVGSRGLMILNGTNVNMRRGGIQVAPLAGEGTAETVDGSQFFPDVGIIDNYWGVGTDTINTANILSRAVVGNVTNWQAISPIHTVQALFGLQLQTVVFANPAIPFVRITNGPIFNLTITNDIGEPTNFPLVTNFVIQAAFVGVANTNIGVQARFTPSPQPTNVFNSISVELASTISNSVTLQEDRMALYIVDRLTSGTNLSLSANIDVYPTTFRPAPYLVSRIPPIQFLTGNAPNANALLTTNLLYDSATFTNANASALYAGYSFTADRLADQQPTIPAASLTNIPGRIEIHATSALNLERTRLRSDGLVTIKGKHLISSTNANVDAFNLRYDLGSTNGTLRIQNLAKATVDRFGGICNMWSGTWSNSASFVITNNYAPDTNDPPVYVPAPITNTITFAFHVLIVDADLTIPVPVTMLDFIARGTNVFIADPLTITNHFFTDAQRLSIEGPAGAIQLANGVPNWTINQSPNLRYVTNHGNIVVQNEARFGYDAAYPATSLISFVNKSNLTAAGIFVTSAYFENGGSINSDSVLSLNTVSGRFENGQSFTGSDLLVHAHDFKLRNTTNQSLGVLSFVITNSFFDNGPFESNRVVCTDGFHVQFATPSGKPVVGDLLGTSFETAAPQFASIQHTWPGDDRGPEVAGYTNNLALGRLVLSSGFDSELVFAGTGTSNALYVDFLSFQGIDLASLETALVVAPNLVIYFADSNLPVEQLDGMLGGRLRWVRNYAGAYSSIDLLVNGNVIKVNRGLRQSLIIDSDGDGLANGFDASPFDPAVLNLTVMSGSPLTLALDWHAAASTVYKVEYTTNNAQSWQVLKHYTNSLAQPAAASVIDQVPAGSPQRYYRVSYQP